MIAMQALIDPGDEVVVVTPVWPNLVAQPQVMGARVRCVALQPVAHGPQAGLWQLPMQQLLDALTPGTRVLVLNAPNNPTGWTLSRDEQQVLLDHCRSRGIWIVADEVYERLYYPEPHAGTPPAFDANPSPCAPSFLDLALPDDRLVVVHSFSKSFLMTGWRLGWMVMPPALVHPVGKLIEFNTSCSPVFVQKAGLAALMHEPNITPRVVAHLRHCRQRLIVALRTIPGVTVAAPCGGMYAFFKLEGVDDSLVVAKRLVAEVGLGLAPGTAFAPEAQGWLRWCFASKDLERLSQGVERLKRWRAL
jgi:aspartate/methionine/tyrosine aminotransferase